jgi:heme-degrading monooxygenase HmoA
MHVVRISTGRFEPKHAPHVERRLAESEHALRGALTKLPGLLHYYAGVDRARGAVINVSVWDSMEHAHQMDTLTEMLAQRPLMEAAGVVFEPITNHETAWTITP